MVRVKTLRKHDNAYGEKYHKAEGAEYDHPDPAQLIRDKIVEKVEKEKADADDGKGGGASRIGSGSK